MMTGLAARCDGHLRISVSLVTGLSFGALADGNRYMAHKCGFTQKNLTQALQGAGFKSIAVMRRPKCFDLWAVASKREMNEVELRNLAEGVLPV
ncbi:MAG: hypothetical protein GY737_16145 [Desulfobacteraceae bacterium]|nr:hypothetical protein [Desulfobacteraceae bacterium]